MTPQITAVIPTCPRPSYPSTKILDETMASLRVSLPDVPVIITCDGPRADCSEVMLANYDQFCSTIMTRYSNSEVIRFDIRGHQTGNLEAVLPRISTDLMFYLEDDWEILPDIPWPEMSDLILSGKFNCIKLHAQPRIHPYHEHLMVDRVLYHGGVAYDRFIDASLFPPVPLVRTLQFSANPHLASVAWYRDMAARFLHGKTDFIENILHGVAGLSPWEEFRMGILNPAHGDMMRVRHLDGRHSE